MSNTITACHVLLSYIPYWAEISDYVTGFFANASHYHAYICMKTGLCDCDIPKPNHVAVSSSGRAIVFHRELAQSEDTNDSENKRHNDLTWECNQSANFSLSSIKTERYSNCGEKLNFVVFLRTITTKYEPFQSSVWLHN